MTRKRNSGRKITEILQGIGHRKRVKKIALSALLVIIVLIFVSGSRGTYQLYKFNRQKTDLEKQIESLEINNKKLEKMKSSIENDPDYIEKIAREKYKMKKKEEKVYEIVEE
jgi:cell division protein FtsL